MNKKNKETSFTTNPYTDLPQSYFDWVEGGALFLFVLSRLAQPGKPQAKYLTANIAESLPAYRSQPNYED